jgi:tRNA threonylcarbamoyladenosine biosynthesis protein TsaE
MEKKLLTHSKEETKALGKALSAFLRPGDVILLEGDLGAGKTTFVGGVADGLHIQEDVISPTFNIMKCYFHGSLPLYHIDAYRLEGQNIEIGLDEYIEGDGACFIEWPDFIAPLIPEEKLEIVLRNVGQNDREIVMKSDAARFEEIIGKLEVQK